MVEIEHYLKTNLIVSVGSIITCIVPSLLLIICLAFTLEAAAKTRGGPKTRIRKLDVSLDAVCATAETISHCLNHGCQVCLRF